MPVCVAAVGKITELRGKRAVVSFKGALKEVSIALVPKAGLGDSVVVHAGFAAEIVKDTRKLYQDVVATDAYARQLLDAIERENEKLRGKQFRIMNFCGTHENTIVQYGLRELLPPNIQLVSGPGCPVCVTPEGEIALGLQAALRKDVILTTYSDLMRVPTPWGALEQIRLEGAKVKIVYDMSQALQLARDCKEEIVHFAVGFETTAPGTASVIREAKGLDNFSIISSHRITLPAMEYVILNSEIDGVLCPGHVAMVTGTGPFDLLCREFGMPCVIAGFEPVDVLEAILKLLHQLENEVSNSINQYSRVVEGLGNTLAQKLIEEVFTLGDSVWRGIGLLPKSRLVLKPEYNRFDAEIKFGLKIPEAPGDYKKSCICGEILKGAKPQLCTNFGEACTPSTPMGPCMVSHEGACHIAYSSSIL